jgi:hypothetical protein
MLFFTLQERRNRLLTRSHHDPDKAGLPATDARHCKDPDQPRHTVPVKKRLGPQSSMHSIPDKMPVRLDPETLLSVVTNSPPAYNSLADEDRLSARSHTDTHFPDNDNNVRPDISHPDNRTVITLLSDADDDLSLISSRESSVVSSRSSRTRAARSFLPLNSPGRASARLHGKIARQFSKSLGNLSLSPDAAMRTNNNKVSLRVNDDEYAYYDESDEDEEGEDDFHIRLRNHHHPFLVSRLSVTAPGECMIYQRC